MKHWIIILGLLALLSCWSKNGSVRPTSSNYGIVFSVRPQGNNTAIYQIQKSNYEFVYVTVEDNEDYIVSGDCVAFSKFRKKASRISYDYCNRWGRIE